MLRPDAACVGWDIGGAHVKACVLLHGRVVDVAQWACPLWQGMDQLESVLEQATRRWPDLAFLHHGVTMTGEMTDLFAHREEGVQRIAAAMAARWPETRFFAGDAGWCSAEEAGAQWAQVASANWLASARHTALALGGEGVLVDIGSTTTDLIAWRGGRVLTTARSDAQRLASGELVYHGVVRTPLCSLGPRITWRGEPLNVMNEFFATTADVYRLTGELQAEHDLYPPADSGAKDTAATQARLARMIGLDARDATADEWLAFAGAWRQAQVAELGGQLARVLEAHRMGPAARLVSAGCGAFLVPGLATAAGRPGLQVQPYAQAVAAVGDMPDPQALAGWAQVCAPCVAVAALLDWEQR
jgi:(4-(4-[2-(gamma-L-glutamylamino)ethyl]phenoxymethyl)furan-2-yl)methanamine synthase